jgi:hypothetical protein
MQYRVLRLRESRGDRRPVLRDRAPRYRMLLAAELNVRSEIGRHVDYPQPIVCVAVEYHRAESLRSVKGDSRGVEVVVPRTDYQQPVVLGVK